MRRTTSPPYASPRRPYRKDSDGATEQRGPRSGLSEMATGNSASTRYDSGFRESARPSPRGQGSSIEEFVAVSARPLSIFYGYPEKLIARWCGVSVATARLYKSGTRKPSRQALRLFALYRDGRVLDDHWKGFAIRGANLVDPQGREFAPGQLNAHWLIVQLARELATKDPRDLEAYRRILRSA